MHIPHWVILPREVFERFALVAEGFGFMPFHDLATGAPILRKSNGTENGIRVQLCDPYPEDVTAKDIEETIEWLVRVSLK